MPEMLASYIAGAWFTAADDGVVVVDASTGDPVARVSSAGLDTRAAVEHARSVHVLRSGEPEGWQLCPEHAVEFLNQLRTVEPKLSVETLSLAGDWR